MIPSYLKLLFILVANPMIIFDFSENTDLSQWEIVNDVVMGGQSKSALTIDVDGNGLFSGTVSLENNGGFCSVRCSLDTINVEEFEKIAFRVKGDGKRYQVRVKARSSDFYSYIAYFNTTGEWQTVEVALNEMYPSVRGRRLNGPNFKKESIEEMSFLIGNSRNESFQLLIDKIMLK